MSRTRSLIVALGLGLAATLVVSILGRPSFDFGPGDRAFARLVAGATPQGTVRDRAVVVLPGLDRGTPRNLVVRVAGARSMRVAVDRGPLDRMRSSSAGEVAIRLEPAGSPGARLDLAPAPGEGPFRLESVRLVERGRRPIAAAVVSGILTALVAFGASIRYGGGAALGLFAAGAFALAWTPSATFLSFPDGTAAARLAPVVALLGTALALGRGRNLFRRGAFLVAALVLGVFLRWSFLASSGSWDTDVWKAWMLRSVSHGLTQAYGGPDAVPDGHFWLQVRGEEDPWRILHAGRLFVIDYPPLAILSWHASWRVVTLLVPALDYGEAQNAAVKLPAVLGDVLALFVLLWALRDATDRGLSMAALYWALPIAWYSSAVLGFLDGAFAPLALAALVAAARGRAWAAGLLLSLAFWIKPLAVIVAPALLVSLATPGSMRRTASAVARAAIPAALVSILVALPYWLAETLDTMIVHLVRLFAAGNLSSGYANPWWVAGHWLSVARGDAVWSGAVSIVRLSDVDFEVALVGTSLTALVTATACFFQYRSSLQGAVLLSGATAFLAYSLLGMGVFENHPHFVFLLLLATGLASPRMRFLFAALGATYVLNLFFLGGIGRFYGLRYWILEGAASWHGWARMAAGFDGTLALAAVNSIAFALWLWWLPGELRRDYDANTT